MASPAGVRSPATLLEEFARDVRIGLSSNPKTLPSRYLYDAVGSALFDVITVLPEYGLTRADERVLVRAAPALVEHFGEVSAVVELGSGSGLKTRPVLEAFAAHQSRLRYVAIDGSKAALERCRHEVAEVPGLEFEGLETFYLDGLSTVFREARNGPVLVLFLGGSIGNFDLDEGVAFLADVRSLLDLGDGLLLGTDLDKSVADLVRAYDDPAGVTAAFNLNLLARINRELGGGFDLSLFEHEARWAPREKRIEMHLKSLVDQAVPIAALGRSFAFRRHETIWTESSHRYTPALLEDLARRTGFVGADSWTDEMWAFRESLWMAAAPPGPSGGRARSVRS